MFGPWADNYIFDTNFFGAGSSNATGGQIEATQRVNTSFVPFDQSKIGNSIFDVLSTMGATAITAAGAAAGKALGDAINPNTENKFLRNFFAEFSSTKTGQQIQKEAALGAAQKFFMNPMVWMFSALGMVALVLLARR